MRESEIEKHLVQRIERCKGVALKITANGRVGWPDRLVLLPCGEGTWVELKTQTGVVEPAQQRVHFLLRELGQEVVVLRSKSDIDKQFPIE